MKTKIIPIKDKKALQKALNTVKKGKIIIYPAETSYGIGCDPKNPKAVKKVHKIKKEPSSKPLIILVSNTVTAKKIGKLTKTDEKLVKKFMPGPLTLVVEKKNNKDTVAFRISSNKFAFNLSEKFKAGIVSTSANLHRKKPIYSSKKVIELFNGKVDLIIDAGTLPKKIASTVYDSKNKKILRKGKISKKQIKKVSEKK